MDASRDKITQRICFTSLSAVRPEIFTDLAPDAFRYQATHNTIYAQFLELLRVDPATVRLPADIPHLPIALFKRYQLQSSDWSAVCTFTSSGTKGVTTVSS